MEPIRVAFLWHQHQPYYKENGEYLLPWVRFHGVKDYWDMVRILDDYPKIKQTFNLAPSLILQIMDYVNNKAEDKILKLTRKKAEDLTEDDKFEILKNFFMANFDRMIKPYPRYLELFNKRGGFSYSNEKFEEVSLNFTQQDWLDLQVWYNLVWVGEYSKYDEPFKKLFEKGKNFTEEEKQILIKGHYEILSRIIPKHIEAQERGQIEVSISPFYHPILPLLCDSSVAKISSPNIKLPTRKFTHPEDADAQIKKAIELYTEIFGENPNGMWPSEGAISEEVISLMVENKIKWTASDEEVLLKSLAIGESDIKDNSRIKIYKPYRFKTPFGEIKIVFRDRILSDLIGFVYSSWGPDDSAHDLVNRILRIRDEIIKNEGEEALRYSLVSIILDGENCWEYYQSDGKDFLRTLYWLISNDERIETIRLNDFLSNTKTIDLKNIYPGSWINANFNIWIGHEEDNRAWDLLKQTRDFLVRESLGGKHSGDKIKKAWEEIYIAEGSDWCWWFGDEHVTAQADEFDLLFRKHLIRVYELLDAEPPVELLHPIKRKFVKFFVVEPKKFIYPIIDGSRTRNFEWEGAGYYDTAQIGTAMHQVSAMVKRIYFGFNEEKFFIRVATSRNLTEKHRIEIHFIEPCETRIEFNHEGFSVKKIGKREKQGIFEIKYAFEEIFEFAISRKTLCASDEISKIKFHIHVYEDHKAIERWPRDESIVVSLKNKTR
ncbi:Alpha-amylase/alpha-mannosidase, GH57 family [Candidatus Kryptonium thompsonii]|uniref:Alpha-amylase/alpha-mannosidase, GH57 family n=2 Tax=Candidatus Kryptonium thompsonii TaxID=1633631 RepID=A0A0P1M4Q3_9BACT|nr:glycoside hydrolase family 57 protein [Candidatus Kryptonium thompsoni]CUS78412.1 Alpha-amylase/alpha-mannosidase, GH57 family [Candidatus Kryptonium thompsoni]CUS81039.1 Alpha-amylase/alpha-mannosidase, GH57 family [Candidatus Kryptonium thompsoni]CUS81246.1 Alpha-amylase/alpha-mannosidase, GH57 family [Candidatus Kryptonium thompsoni]CUS84860.1 Alpha-amylase/alpha-mannosidase, GH57 family [Candidatus Kryptonium thompsoni]CUS89553.1 Alpha-amylase/alpha-mannosidase, GH57 family [Candidatus 